MTAPQLTAYANGPIAIGGDQLNTFMQTCDTAAQMRGLIGVVGMSLYARGINSVNDGLGGDFYWNSTATGPDDNLNTIVPAGSGSGAWVRVIGRVVTSFNGRTGAVTLTTADVTTVLATAQATAQSFSAGAVPFVDWLDIYAYGGAGTPIVGLSNFGGAGVSGASRASLGTGPSSAAIGTLGFSFADGSGATAAGAAWGGYFEARVFAGSTGYGHGIEVNITNFAGAPVALSPYEVFNAGGTNALWVASGGGVGRGSPPYQAYNPATGVSDITTAFASSCAIAIVNNGAPHNIGILFDATAIVGTDGVTGGGTAIALARGHVIEWFTPSGHQAGTITSTASSSTPAPISMQFNDAGLTFLNTSLQGLFGINPVPPAPGGTSIVLLVNNNAGIFEQPVTLGAADSGGTGFRALVVPN